MGTSAATTALPHLEETILATTRYLAALTELTEEAARGPSRLPGWTRGHVVTHLARNADALGNLLHSAQSGEQVPMYPSRESRDAAIEAGAGRDVAELREDAAASAGRWLQAVNELHADHLDAPVVARTGGEPFPVRRVAAMRRTEVEVHHADLDLGYGPADWPSDLVSHLLQRRERELREDGIGLSVRASDTGEGFTTGAGPDIEGSAADLVWWLLGRGDGSALTCSGGSLPELGPWA